METLLSKRCIAEIDPLRNLNDRTPRLKDTSYDMHAT